MRKFFKKVSAGLLCLLLMTAIVLPAKAQTVLRVAFYPLDGFFEYDSEGKETGYGVELLDRISRYTGIQFEYVPADSWESTKDMLLRGEADIRMPGTMPIIQSDTVTLKTRIADAHCVEENIPPHRVDLIGRRVLLCEDHPLNREIACKLLETVGICVTSTENGRQGVEAFEQSGIGEYDAILMDIRMPVMDGLSATRAIRALTRPDAAVVPIIAMTANAFREDVQTALDAGMTAHLAKPIEPARLYQTLTECLAPGKNEP